MDIQSLREQLLRHEGCVLHAYQDHLGYLTVGVGRLIDKRRGGGITKDEAMFLLDADITRVLSRLCYERGFTNFPDSVQEALVNMAFQLGHSGLMEFKKMWAALRHQDYEKAADEALDSKWASQTPRRAYEVSEMIRAAS